MPCYLQKETTRLGWLSRPSVIQSCFPSWPRPWPPLFHTRIQLGEATCGKFWCLLLHTTPHSTTLQRVHISQPSPSSHHLLMLAVALLPCAVCIASFLTGFSFCLHISLSLITLTEIPLNHCALAALFLYLPLSDMHLYVYLRVCLSVSFTGN